MSLLPSKATHRQTREFNVRLVLRCLYDLGPVSRAEIARQTHLTRTTVSDVVSGLLDEQLVEEVGRGPSSGGKAPILLRVVPEARLVIGLDLGEEAFTGALVDLRGTIRHEERIPIEGQDGEAALALVYRLVDRMLERAHRPLLGIGVGTPGVIDTAGGVIRWAVNLDWQNLPLASLLERRFGLPVQVVNDCRAAALAMYAFWVLGSRPANLIAVKAGKGIGAGIVMGGELMHGDGFGAGEIGHVVVVDGGDACRCGRRGCLETVASAGAITGNLAGSLAGGPPMGRPPTLDQAREAFERGDARARTVVLTAGRYLGGAIAAMIGAMDIHRIVLHGSVTEFGEPWLASVREHAGQRTLGLLASDVDISVADSSVNLAVLGASALLMTSQLGLSLTR
jgi:predicted NBD/HSP70 family sugar kinase